MTKATKQEQGPTPAKHPAPAGKAEQPEGRNGREAPVAELTDTDLQAVSGGGGRGGLGGDVSR